MCSSDLGHRELVGLVVALVVVVLARADEDVHRGDAQPRLVAARDPLVFLVHDLGDPRTCRRIRHDDEALALREPAARCAADGGDDALDRLARDRLGVLVADHAPLLEEVGEVHGLERYSSGLVHSGVRATADVHASGAHSAHIYGSPAARLPSCSHAYEVG